MTQTFTKEEELEGYKVLKPKMQAYYEKTIVDIDKKITDLEEEVIKK